MRTLRTTLLTVFAVAAFLMISGFVPTMSRAFAAPADFIAEPVPSADTAAGYFKISAASGTRASGAVRLTNPGAKPVVVHAAAVDATTASLGGVSYALAAKAPKAVGRWIDLERSAIRLAAGEAATVRFSVAVPSDAAVGDHVGGVALWVKGAEGSETVAAAAGQAGATISTQTRRVIAVQIVVPGASRPALQVDGVSAAGRPAGMELDVAISDIGTQLTGDGTIHLELPGTEFVYDGAVGTSLPGTAFAYPVRWSTEPADGVYPAHVVLSYAGTTTEWTGEFRVGEEQQQELADRMVGAERAAGRSWTYVAVLAGGLVAIVVIGIAIGRRMRSRRP